MSRALAADIAQGEPTAGRLVYAGLFLTTLATLMEEILLTRIFSVTMWYHYAFMAVSIAMFGMTVGALFVYLAPGHFTRERVPSHLALSSLLFSLAIVFSFLLHLALPFTAAAPVSGLCTVVLTYLVISVPFVFSGICVCLALTAFPRQVGALYAADLAGAAVGCVLLVAALEVTDGPTAVVVVATVAGAGSVLFAAHARLRRPLRAAVVVTAVFGLLAVGHTVLVHKQAPLLRLRWVKHQREGPALFEKWNSFSRLRVTGDPDHPRLLPAWRLSPAAPPHLQVRQLTLSIDATASSPLNAFAGDVRAVSYLKYDVTNVVHALRPAARVLVVGPGGGRDILSALAFGQRSVLAVEMNGDIVDIVNRRFGDFTGHLDRDPRVRFVKDEARSYIARQKETFDIIQISFIDTWAATAAGAFVLAENSLYTTEAWRVFLKRLTPRGVLSVSRWYSADGPAEAYRLVSLATAALLESGVKRPADHLLLVRHMLRQPDGKEEPAGVGTILVSPSPFSAEDLRAAAAAARRLGFEVVLSPRFALDATLAAIASGKDLVRITSHYPLDITPPTDDRPFFFHMLRFRDIFDRQLVSQGAAAFNRKAVHVLGVLLIAVVGLTLACVIVPLVWTTERAALDGAAPLLTFFAAIGLGFMFIEISQMQRLIVFLGHPTYGLSVVLFSLLISCGLGSYATQGMADRGGMRSARGYLLILVCGLIAFGLLTPYLIRSFQASSTPFRILLSVAMLFPLGVLMGMPFPLGMRLASTRSAPITPWLWGVNGATSVCASVLAVVVAMSAGIAASFWVGAACYGAALLAFTLASRRPVLDATPRPGAEGARAPACRPAEGVPAPAEMSTTRRTGECRRATANDINPARKGLAQG